MGVMSITITNNLILMEILENIRKSERFCVIEAFPNLSMGKVCISRRFPPPSMWKAEVNDPIPLHMTRYHFIWPDTTSYDPIPFNMTRDHLMTRYHFIWFDTISYDSIPFHMTRYHFIWPDTISYDPEICRCNQGIEDTNHFLFSCPDYAIPRATLAASVINILQKNNLNYLGNQSQLYLYGHPSIIFTDNRKIILSTIKYMKATLRFSS